MCENLLKMFCRKHPITPDDEIVISGIAARFPNARNMNEFSYNLYNKVCDEFYVYSLHNVRVSLKHHEEHIF